MDTSKLSPGDVRISMQRTDEMLDAELRQRIGGYDNLPPYKRKALRLKLLGEKCSPSPEFSRQWDEKLNASRKKADKFLTKMRKAEGR